MISHRRLPWLIGLAVALLLGTAVAANLGPMHLSWQMLWSGNHTDFAWRVWFDIRLPRVLLALLVGLALALSGAVMQGLFRNPLADPGLLGISSGAGLAVALAVAVPLALPATLALWVLMLAAFIGSMAVTVLIFHLTYLTRGDLSRIILIGVAINAICIALIGILSWLVNDQQLRQLSLWGMGSLGQAQWQVVGVVCVLVVPAALLVQRDAQRLNLLQLGEEDAHYLGVAVRRTQRRLLILSSILVGCAVSVSGLIGFVGLVIPHIVRLLFGSNHRWLLPFSALGGAALLLLADTIARTAVSPAEMPVGLLTSLVGGPWFFWLILRSRTSLS